MTVRLRYRPVVFGPLERPTAVYHALESADGQVSFRDLEFTWPVPVSLDAMRLEHLPARYRTPEAEARLLAVREATGPTASAAFERMLGALSRLERGMVPQAREGAA